MMWTNFLISLEIMAKGMAGIFAVIGILTLAVMLMGSGQKKTGTAARYEQIVAKILNFHRKLDKYNGKRHSKFRKGRIFSALFSAVLIGERGCRLKCREHLPAAFFRV